VRVPSDDLSTAVLTTMAALSNASWLTGLVDRVEAIGGVLDLGEPPQCRHNDQREAADHL
jgi:hypothetical protein